jgi:hypothetical protein
LKFIFSDDVQNTFYILSGYSIIIEVQT